MEPSDDRDAPSGNARPIVRDYTIASLSALLIMLLVLSEGFGMWSVVPLVIGALGVLTSGSFGPPLVLLTLGVLLFLPTQSFGIRLAFHELSSFLQIVLAAATLVYLACSMRLLSLVSHAMPPDSRSARRPPGKTIRGRWLLPRETTARSTPSISSSEIGSLLLSVPLFVAIAYFVQSRIEDVKTLPASWNGSVPMWRLIVVIWGAGIILAAVGAFLTYRRGIQASREESLLYLQDQLWAATRGEQRRASRWIAWARLRRQRKEEGK
jgi:hypothetical protein